MTNSISINILLLVPKYFLHYRGSYRPRLINFIFTTWYTHGCYWHFLPANYYHLFIFYNVSAAGSDRKISCRSIYYNETAPVSAPHYSAAAPVSAPTTVQPLSVPLTTARQLPLSGSKPATEPLSVPPTTARQPLSVHPLQRGSPRQQTCH